MTEFYIQFFTNNILLLIACIACFFTYKNTRNQFFLVFLLYLIQTFIIQWVCLWIAFGLHKQNHFIINSQIIVNIFFFWYFFSHSFANYKKIVHGIFCCLLVFGLVNIISIQGYFKLNTYTYNLQAFISIVGSFIYFYNHVNISNKPIFRDYFFWISIGFFGSCLIEMSYYLFFDYIIKYKLDPGGRVFGWITFLSGLMLNLLFLYACKNAYKWQQQLATTPNSNTYAII
jgi:hypothetical protein